MSASQDGLLLLGSSMNPIYANSEAMQILAYPESPRGLDGGVGFLARKVQSVLLNKPLSPQSGFVNQVQSGRRRYMCRTFSLGLHPNGQRNVPTVAVLMERCGRVPLDLSELAEEFHLTRREGETVGFLVQGMTSKEIAQQMKISPNTVKAFLRLIMVKMGATTRSGIIGKILETGTSHF